MLTPLRYYIRPSEGLPAASKRRVSRSPSPDTLDPYVRDKYQNSDAPLKALAATESGRDCVHCSASIYGSSLLNRVRRLSQIECGIPEQVVDTEKLRERAGVGIPGLAGQDRVS